MNFISEMASQEIHVELKYCERCGALWLRPQGRDGVYCTSCQACLAAMLDPGEPRPRKARRRKARLQGKNVLQDVKRTDQRPIQIDYLEGVAAMEVWA
jgi:hypothetical protein